MLKYCPHCGKELSEKKNQKKKPTQKENAASKPKSEFERRMFGGGV